MLGPRLCLDELLPLERSRDEGQPLEVVARDLVPLELLQDGFGTRCAQVDRDHPSVQVGFELLGEKGDRHAVDLAQREHPRKRRDRLAVLDARQMRLGHGLRVAQGHLLDGVEREPAVLADPAQVPSESSMVERNLALAHGPPRASFPENDAGKVRSTG